MDQRPRCRKEIKIEKGGKREERKTGGRKRKWKRDGEGRESQRKKKRKERERNFVPVSAFTFHLF